LWIKLLFKAFEESFELNETELASEEHIVFAKDVGHCRFNERMKLPT
jgi:hypothetical protein